MRKSIVKLLICFVFLLYFSHYENDISGSLARHEAKTADRIVVNAELLTCTDCATDIITELLNCLKIYYLRIIAQPNLKLDQDQNNSRNV